MLRILGLVLATAIPTATLAQPAHAQEGAVYVATYIEVVPNQALSATALLERLRAASRKEDGNLRFDTLHELARANRFAILEVWKDAAALEAHEKAAATLELREELKAIQSAPADQRINSIIHGRPAQGEDRAGAIVVLTHVDVTPVHKDDCLASLGTMSAEISKDSGNIGYQVLQQQNRGNHFTVVEEWTSRKSLDAHAMAAHTRALREKLSPMLGALYDERLYSEF